MPEPFAPLLLRKSLVGAAIETTSGTDVLASITTPLSGTAVYNAVVEPIDPFAEGQRRPDGHYLGNVDAAQGRKMARLRFTQELTPSSAFFTLIQACAYFNSGGYKPTSNVANMKTASFKVWQDGKLYSLFGAAGTFSIRIEVGRPITVDFDFQGVWSTDADSSMPAQSPINTLPYIAKSVTVTVGGATPPHWTSMVFDANNTVVARDTGGSAGGVAHYLVTERDPTISVDYEGRLVAQFDAFGLLMAGTTAAITATATKGANSFLVAAGRAQRRNVNQGDRDGIRTHPTVWQLNASSGDDEVAFTEA